MVRSPHEGAPAGTVARDEREKPRQDPAAASLRRCGSSVEVSGELLTEGALVRTEDLGRHFRNRRGRFALRPDQLCDGAGVGLLVYLDPVVPGIEAALRPDELGLSIRTESLGEAVHPRPELRASLDEGGGTASRVCVVVAVDDQAHADRGQPLLGESGQIAPFDVRSVDEDGGEDQRIGGAVLAVDHLQLAVVLVYRDELRDSSAEQVNEI